MIAAPGPVVINSFADDVALGCRHAVEALHRDYVLAALEHRHVAPPTSARTIGHFGYFHGSAAVALRDQTLESLRN